MTRVTLNQLRRYAVARTLFRPTTLTTAIERLGFVQADPIRAPARAQDLILRHRVSGYRAGQLERSYPGLPLEEDAFVNYGYLPRDVARLMHPRTPRRAWTPQQERDAAEVLEFVRDRGVVHPREVDEHFRHGRITNWFGGTSNASTHLLDGMHHRGILRVHSRVSGTRTYAVAGTPEHAIDPVDGLTRLLDVAVGLYAPVPRGTLGQLASLLRYGALQWMPARKAVLAAARDRYAWAVIDGEEYCWPVAEDPSAPRWAPRNRVRLLAPFDPIVWDRRRFAHLWGWEYRFEAYTPAAKRVRGYYALPLLWRDRVVGWANVSVQDGALSADLGYAAGAPPGHPAFASALDEELDRMSAFLGDRS